MSNTTIKLKRTDFAASIDAIVLQRGEPAIDFDRQILWVGDGDVNLQFAAVNSDAASHSVTSAGESGDVHTVTVTKYGSVLKGTATTKASFQRLGFYDLGDIAVLPSTNASFPSQDVSDTTGILSRWHWIEKTHAGPRRSLFMTNTSISGVGTGSNGSGMGNMRHAGGASAADLTGYRVEALSYEYAGDMLMTNPEFDGGGSHVLVVDYTSSLSNNVLKFRRLLAADIEGGSPVHEMTSDSHSCSASLIYYSRGVNDMTSLSFLSGTVAGKVIKRASSTALEWSTVDWSEITGNFNPDLGSVAANNNTMRFDATLSRWVINPYVNSINDSAAGWNGHEIINTGFTGRTIGTTYKAYSGSTVISTVEMCLPGSTKKVNQYYIGSNDGGFVFNIKGNHDQFLFYAGNNPDAGDVPNFWIRKTGGVRIQATTRHDNLFALTNSGTPAKSADLEIGSKTNTRQIVFDSASRPSLPEYSGILISETSIRQDHATAVATAEVAGLRIDNITYTSGSGAPDYTNPCQPTYMLRLGNVSSTNTTIGARFGSVTVTERVIDPTITGRTACGLYFDSIRNARDETGSNAFGIRFDQIVAGYGSTTAGGSAYGVNIGGVSGFIDAYGFNFSTSITGKRNAYGININAISNDTGVAPSTTASNTIGLNIGSIRNGANVAGISITDITSGDTTKKTVGLFINLGANTSLQSTSVATNDPHVIYAIGGKTYLGGATTLGWTGVGTTLTVLGQTVLQSSLAVWTSVTISQALAVGNSSIPDTNYVSNFYGDVKIRRIGAQGVGRRLSIDGNGTDEVFGGGQLISSVISIERGHIDVTSGDLRLYSGIVRDNTFDSTILDQGTSTDEYLKAGNGTVIDVSKYRTLILTTSTAGSPVGNTPHSIWRIKPGYNGQRLTLVARIAATSATKRYIELQGADTDNINDSNRQSNIVIEKSDYFDDVGSADQEIHVYHDQPVELVFVENYFATAPTWTSTYVGDYPIAQRSGAWILLH